MAKSLRSKSRQRAKFVQKEKKKPKELARLKKTLETRTIIEINKAVDEAKAARMEEGGLDGSKGTIDLKTMRTKEGKFPEWLSSRKQKQAKIASRKAKLTQTKKKAKRR